MTIRALPAAFALFLVLTGLAAARPSAPIEIPDPEGDAGCCSPDISHVQVSNDPKGILTVVATIANRPRFLPGDLVDLYLDPEPDAPGDGYSFDIEFDGRETTFFVAGDDDWYEVPFFEDIEAAYDGSRVTFRVNPDQVEIDGPFRLIVSTQNESTEDVDDAPAEPGLRYRIDAPPLSVLEPPRPATPRVGKPWIVGMKVRGATSSGQVACSASIGSRKLAARPSWFTIYTIVSGAGVALKRVTPSCVVTIPKGVRGKLVSATLGVTQHGMTVQRTTKLKVR